MTLRELRDVLNNLEEDALDNELKIEMNYTSGRSFMTLVSLNEAEFDGVDKLIAEATDIYSDSYW